MGRQTFRSPKLNGLVQRVRHGGAAKSVRTLERLIRALEQRNKEWFFLPSTVLLYATQICMAVEHWRQKHRASMAEWLDAWAEFEALNALAGYAYEHPENTYPQFTEGGARFEGEALGHPLLAENACIRNDVRLDGVTRFYIVSGSNMTGKSTLLRAIGVNAVLALAGAPVRARSLRLSRFSICASISVGDSLLNGKSKFLAEVERVRQTIELARGERPVLFLIDEIFSGTNSRDRSVLAESVVGALTGYGAVGALSTHDLALTGMVDRAELRGCNMHMGCRDGGGPLDFDYLLKPGVTQESNALDIARMVGIAG
jgi:DNA mismatch repair ATPase MutS